jgi:membrane protease YdiL (CAAX protease family)
MIKAKSSPTNPLLIVSLKRPVLTGLVLMFIALCFKFVDHFVLRLDERLGEIILSKSLGFVLVILFVWLAGRTLKDIGLHSKSLGTSVSIGVIVTVIAFIVGYGVDFFIQLHNQAQPTFLVDAIDSKAGVSGRLLFGVWLVLGNFINAFMEEGLFRGVMIRLFRVKLNFWRTNWLQAFLFGIWHLPWVLKYLQMGTIETTGEILFAVFSNSVPQLLMGMIWGYLFLKTGNLWAPWAAHVLANSVGNLLHITSLNGLDSGFALRMAIYTVAALLCMFLVKHLAERNRMSEVKPWGEWASP